MSLKYIISHAYVMLQIDSVDCSMDDTALHLHGHDPAVDLSGIIMIGETVFLHN